MSFILDALKKLESEKKKKEMDTSVMEQLLSDDENKIRNSIFNKKITFNLNTLLLSSGLLFICIVLISFIFFKNNKTLKTSRSYAQLKSNKSSTPSVVKPLNKNSMKKTQEIKEYKRDFSKVTSSPAKTISSTHMENKDILHRLKISAIFYKNNGGSKAVVNGKIVFEGDKIIGAEVLKIGSESILFKFKERKFTLKF